MTFEHLEMRVSMCLAVEKYFLFKLSHNILHLKYVVKNMGLSNYHQKYPSKHLVIIILRNHFIFSLTEFPLSFRVTNFRLICPQTFVQNKRFFHTGIGKIYTKIEPSQRISCFFIYLHERKPKLPLRPSQFVYNHID